MGRYVYPKELPDGRFLLDFNQAFNPACAISPFYNCPIPDKENKLPKLDIDQSRKDANNKEGRDYFRMNREE